VLGAPHPGARPSSTTASLAGLGAAHEYELLPDSQVELAFGSRQPVVRGRVRLVRGRLWLDVRDLGAARGELIFDLATTVFDAAGAAVPEPARAPSEARTLTEQSLDWLQIGPSGVLGFRPELRFARFTLTSLVADDVARDPRASAASRSRTSDRGLRAKASGDLELHGFRLPYTVAVNIELTPQGAGTADLPPERIELVTTTPIAIDPLRHEIVPRDSRGEVQSLQLAELRKPPSNPVQVTARWVAQRTRGASLAPSVTSNGPTL
jgi:hypothetical protein